MASYTTTAAYRLAAWLTEGELHLAGGMLRPPGRFARAKLTVARKLLGKVISDIPASWNSLWIAGKTGQITSADGGIAFRSIRSLVPRGR